MTVWNITLTNRHGQTALVDSEKFVAGIVQTTLQEFLEAEMTEHLKAESYERTSERTGYRNGYKPRVLNLTVGKITLRLPQTREGDFHTELFNCYQRSERAFTSAIVDMWVNGVSTRKVAAITDELCQVRFSKSTVSEMCKSLDAQIGAWKSRSLAEHSYPYVFVDAIYENVRVNGSVTSEGVLIAVGVRDDGRREILDAVVADTESATTYNELFCSLRDRGVSGVRMVVSDAHRGLQAAVGRYFQRTVWQRCQVHFMRDVISRVAYIHREELGADISSIFNEADRDTALKKAKEIALKWSSITPKIADVIEYDTEQCLGVLAFPQEHQKHIRTNNIMERLNKEIRRRDRVIGVFPNEDSLTRLVCAICMEESEDWINAKPWLDMSLLDADG